MKSIIKIFLTVIFSISVIKAQTESLPLIENLESDSISYGIRELSIYEVKHNKLLEYIPYLDTSIFKQPHYYLVSLCLETLSELNSSNIIPIAKAFIDSLDNPYFLKVEKDKIDITESRLFATEILFEHGDYTTAQYIFDYIDNNRENLKHYVYFIEEALELILNNVPSFSEQAKTELIYIAQNNSHLVMRLFAMFDLNKAFGNEMNGLNVDRLVNDEDTGIKMSALHHLFKNNYPDLDELIVERLYADTSRYARIVLADTLLKAFGTPGNYNLVKNYLEVEQNQIARSNIEVSLELLWPKPPYNLNTVIEYLDYTSLLCDTLLAYTWLGDSQFKNELQSILQSAKTNLQNGDSLACREEVKSFQDSVDFVYKDSLNTDPRFVTIDGWKFLYSNAYYILDILPTNDAEKKN